MRQILLAIVLLLSLGLQQAHAAPGTERVPRASWTDCLIHLDWKTETRVVSTHCHSYLILHQAGPVSGYSTRTWRRSPHVRESVRWPLFVLSYDLPGCPFAIARWARYVIPAARAVGLPVRAITGVIAIESGGDPNATNPVSGAAGLMQFMPATAARFGINPYDPAQEIPAGARYIEEVGPLNYSGGGYGWGEVYARSCD